MLMHHVARIIRDKSSWLRAADLSSVSRRFGDWLSISAVGIPKSSVPR